MESINTEFEERQSVCVKEENYETCWQQIAGGLGFQAGEFGLCPVEAGEQ